ncbi:MAG: hypothetical protein ABSB49_02360 [Polyangia bacterium]|jgi:hypothetical protein
MEANAQEHNGNPAGATENEGLADCIPQLRELKQRLQAFDQRMRKLIKERPAACLVGAMALGYLVARIARRSRR